MSEALKNKVNELFDKMDDNNDNIVTKSEAKKHFSVKKFGAVNAQAMFNEVDEDKNDAVTREEWEGFWQQVLNHDYAEADIIAELDNLISGEAWVDWEDG